MNADPLLSAAAVTVVTFVALYLALAGDSHAVTVEVRDGGPPRVLGRLCGPGCVGWEAAGDSPSNWVRHVFTRREAT